MTTATKSLITPYPGLRPFEEEDHPVFFGREAQVNGMLRKLEDQSFLAVVGSSGSGKSSLVRAGLLPAVRQGFLLGTTDWLILVMKPGHQPYQSLARAITLAIRPSDHTLVSAVDLELTTPEEIRTLASLRRTDHGLLSSLGEFGISSKTMVLVVVDQFEELLAFRRTGPRRDPVAPRDEAAAFVRMLLRSCSDAQSRVRVVLTMRSDFIGDCEAFLGLPEAVSHSQFLVPRLDRGEMKEVITRPGEAQDVAFRPFTFEEDLVNRIINDAGDRSDQLPLMQHALMRTWKLANRRAGTDDTSVRITHEDYAGAGGIENALSLHADAAWDEIQLNPQRADLARRLFLLLCDVSPDGQITRRRPRVDEVAAVVGATVPEIQGVMRVFQEDDRNFLLPPANQFLTSTSLLDISHESLIRQWKRFSHWVAEELESAATLNRLRGAALRWPQQEPLLRDPALAIALDWYTQQRPSPAWAERYGGGLDRVLEYLNKSKEEQQREKDEAEAARQKELDVAQRRAEEQAASAKRFRNAAVGLGILLLAATTAAVYAALQRNKVVSLSRSMTALEDSRASLETDIEQLARERQEVESTISKLGGEMTSLLNDRATLTLQQGQLQEFNKALAAIAAAYGTVRPTESRALAVAFYESDDTPDKVLPLLQRVGKVESLNLSRTKISDAGLMKIKRLPALKSLDLSFTEITDQGIAQIAEMPRLTRLILNDTLVTEASLPLLNRLINLKTLDLSRNKVNQASVDRLRENLPGCSIIYSPDPLLDALSLHQGDWDKALNMVGGHRTESDSVDFFQSPITDSAIRFLNEYRQISLAYSQNVTNDGLKYLRRNKRIASLKLQHQTQISDQGIETLVGLGTLSDLTIDGTAITDRGMSAISQLNGLTRLTLNAVGSGITNAGVAHLTSLTRLEHLTLNHSQIKDASLQEISKIRSLRSIELLNNEEVSGRGYAALSELPLLRQLRIGFVSSLTDADLKHLEKLSQLETIELRMTGLTDAGIEGLRKAIPNTKVLFDGKTFRGFRELLRSEVEREEAQGSK